MANELVMQDCFSAMLPFACQSVRIAISLATDSMVQSSHASHNLFDEIGGTETGMEVVMDIPDNNELHLRQHDGSFNYSYNRDAELMTGVNWNHMHQEGCASSATHHQVSIVDMIEESSGWEGTNMCSASEMDTSSHVIGGHDTHMNGIHQPATNIDF
eukprot:scaffold163012_cov29-Prasinocladus_malaysianus.AAC.1